MRYLITCVSVITLSAVALAQNPTPRTGSLPVDRGLRLFDLPATQPCPVSVGERRTMPARAFPAMFWLGEGPIYTTMAWASVPQATFSLSRLPVEGDGRRAKTPWVADATYEGPVVIRGRSLRDDGKALRFKLSGSLVEQLRLQAPQTPVKGEPSFWVLGGPDWVRSERERFDILAKAPNGTARPRMQQMVRTLLADRFQLETHLETRNLPIYALIVARPDGRLGSKISMTTSDCRSGVAARNGGERVTPPPPNGERLACGFQSSLGSIRGTGVQIAEFAHILSFLGVVDRPVIDRSGLTANYQLELRWTPADRGRRVDPDVPSLFTAVREQLGVKLEATTGPVEVLVIDHIERPTEN